MVTPGRRNPSPLVGGRTLKGLVINYGEERGGGGSLTPMKMGGAKSFSHIEVGARTVPLFKRGGGVSRKVLPCLERVLQKVSDP